MICPFCRAENPADAPRCVSCAREFIATGGETIAGGASAAPDPNATVLHSSMQSSSAARTAASNAPAVAAGVLTPPPTPAPSSPSGPPISGSGSGSSPSAASISFSLEPGSDFGPRYRIESKLGEGGMGAVYKAYDKDLDRTVAIKLLRVGMAAEPAAMARFKQELLLASKVSHKNILRIHDLGDVGGIKFISMAYVEGEDLSHVLRREGKLPVERIVKIARQLCGALDAAHSEGVVHRDLKPQNVLLDREANCYISDFGLAKSLEAGAAGMTRSGEFLGTPKYMSPEQVDAKPVDNRSDLYSLGLMLYEMAAGEVPFTGDSVLQVMYARVKTKPKPVKQLREDLPDYLARVIMRCLEKDPAARYQSAKEILVDLDAERATSSTRTVQIQLPAQGWKLWAGVSGAVVLLLVVLLAIPAVRHAIFGGGTGGGLTSRGVPALTEGKFLAVVPFRVLGDPTTLNYIADGLVEGLSAKFFQLRDVKLASAAAVEKAKAKRKDSIEAIAKDLGVNLVIHGMVQGNAEKIRVIVNLEDMAEGKRLWSQEFSGVSGDLLTLEDQMYAKLSDALELKATPEELARGAARPTENIEAYDLYLKGRNAMRNSSDLRNVEAAVKFFEDALKKDPRFALAYTGIADAGLIMYREKKDPFWSEKALAAAQQAGQIDDKKAEVRFSLGSVYRATGKTAEAIAELKHALALAPNSDEGSRRLGSAYLSAGNKEEALKAYQQAIKINPYYWDNHNALGVAYLRYGDSEKALTSFQKVIELEPDNAFGYQNIGAVYFRQGKYEQSIPAFQRALQIRPDYALYSNLGTAYFYLKRYAESVPQFEKAVEMNPNEQVAVGNLADAYRWSGQKDKAMATYDKAISLAFKELQVNPRSAGALGSLAVYYAKKGDAAKAADFIRRAREIQRSDVQLMYKEAQIYALGGKNPEAFRALREAFQKGYSPEEAKDDPELKSLQSQPEFDRLLREFAKKS
jgi:tetratricopeptide (TPR) repeat protein